MNLSSDLMGSGWYLTFNILFCLILLLSLFFIHWSKVAADRSLHHRAGFALVVLCVMWSMRAGISDGMGIHFFMMTALHLTFGWQIAVWVLAFALLGMVWIGAESLAGLGINAIISGVIPILCNYIVWNLHEKKANTNIFTFIFLVAFLGAILSVIMSGVAMTALLYFSDAYGFETIYEQFWIYVPLIAIPEATVNGLIITGLVVYRPSWVRLFNEQKYMSR